MLHFVSEKLARRKRGCVSRWGILLVLLAVPGSGCSSRSTDVFLPFEGVVADAGSGGFLLKLDAHFGQLLPSGYDGASACSGTVEACNGVDDDCDGVIDNGFDPLTDPLNCGSCGALCSTAGGVPACVKGACVIASCNPGHADADKQADNGCECLLTNDGKEACDDADNDCDGVIDNGFDLQSDPNNCGECGVICNIANAASSCSKGACAYTCKPGHYDVNRNPADGCEYACTPMANPAEVCDGVDNDCNGLVDGDDPGLVYVPTDRICYSSAAGSCQAGLLTCVAGKQACVGAGPPSEEMCDGRDNNCDGRIDESDPNLGKPCYVPGVLGCDAAGACKGECRRGAYQCPAGSLTCAGVVVPVLEACDGKDNDCDGVVDNGFDLENDPNNCGGCGQKCSFAHALAVCNKGVCVLDPKTHQGACAEGWVDLNGDPADGCEHQCTPESLEVCDGKDNDCNGLIDNEDPGMLYPTNFCSQIGECGKGPGGSRHAGWETAATYPACTVPAGAPAGTAPAWVCNYPATVELAASGRIAQETWCDGLDNDCDGTVDDPYAKTLGTPCMDPNSPASGACRRTGTLRCQSDKTLPAQCDFAGVPAAISPIDEICDGLDNDCDGLVDESWDNPAGLASCGGHDCLGVRDDVVRVNAAGAPGGSYYIYRYESSRTDATATSQGTSPARACSRAQGPSGSTVLPWSIVTWNQADGACRAAGMRLCRAVRAAGAITSDEWGFACKGGSSCAAGFYPYACSYDANACNGSDRNLGKAAACGSLSSCATEGDLDSESTSDKVFDMSGNLAEWTDDRRDVADTAESSPGAGSESAIYTIRGGAFDSFFAGMACDFLGTQVHPTFAFADTGFRCCSSCPPGQADCSGACKNLGNDSANCGACGAACAAGTTCQNGTCK